ncbi:MAG TPA: hypothetical protein VM366_11230 [Anaerolineae bacterium]|nr:hypothetical protein [Anaerolineae bacterium]
MAEGHGVEWGALRRLVAPVLQAVLIAVIVAVLVELGYPIGPIYPVSQTGVDPSVGIMGVSHFSSVYSSDDVQTVDDVIVGDDCTVAGLATVGETLAVAGDGTVGGTFGVTGVTTLAANASVGGLFCMVEQTFISVTAGLSITPTTSYIGLQSAAAVTTGTTIAITDGSKAGQILVLVNENASDAITIDDGANTLLSGDAVLGASDTLLLIWDGATWLELAQANNT